MREFLSTALVFLTALLVEPTPGAARTLVSDPGLPDSILVDSTFTVLPEPVILPVFFWCDQPLAAVEVTLTHNGPALIIDSFSFNSGQAEHLEFKGHVITGNVVTAFAYQASEDPIASGGGLLGHLWLSYPESTPPQLVTFDSTTVLIDLVERGNYFSADGLTSYRPEFRRGYSSLQVSCCVGRSGNIDHDPGGTVDISDLTRLIIYLFVDLTQEPPCLDDANVDGSLDGLVDIGDLTRLIGYLFIDAELNALAPCPE
ncbi:MAG: hypothetical protein JSU65_12070 [Candidatus Zixiibacteriota bacterium]|nr:MAG: hypothetical protein JSU65_12070 [candidate division Zixibacteria bacterium]